MYNAIQARKFVMRLLERSSAAVQGPDGDLSEEPSCLLDEWTRAMVLSRAAPAGRRRAGQSSSRASSRTAKLPWSSSPSSSRLRTPCLGHCLRFPAHGRPPETLAKIREEQYRVRGGDLDRPLTLDLSRDGLHRAAVKEVTRLMPFVIMASP